MGAAERGLCLCLQSEFGLNELHETKQSNQLSDDTEFYETEQRRRYASIPKSSERCSTKPSRAKIKSDPGLNLMLMVIMDQDLERHY